MVETGEAKEDLSGQSCADPNNWNDRILPNIISDTTLLHCFGSCESDGSMFCIWLYRPNSK